jgi:hypothetical protein
LGSAGLGGCWQVVADSASRRETTLSARLLLWDEPYPPIKSAETVFSLYVDVEVYVLPQDCLRGKPRSVFATVFCVCLFMG